MAQIDRRSFIDEMRSRLDGNVVKYKTLDRPEPDLEGAMRTLLHWMGWVEDTVIDLMHSRPDETPAAVEQTPPRYMTRTKH